MTDVEMYRHYLDALLAGLGLAAKVRRGGALDIPRGAA